MVALYRCRTSLREVSQAFDAAAPLQADWRGEIWPGQTGLVINLENGRRVISAMTWGLPARGPEPFPETRPASTIWFRELWEKNRPLLEPRQRCLIVLEAFAKPERREGVTTRTWYGSESSPIVGWPGVWLVGSHGPGFCGILVASNALVSSHDNMPVLLRPASSLEWLSCDLPRGAILARTSPAADDMYRETTDEPWNTRRA